MTENRTHFETNSDPRASLFSRIVLFGAIPPIWGGYVGGMQSLAVDQWLRNRAGLLKRVIQKLMSRLLVAR